MFVIRRIANNIIRKKGANNIPLFLSNNPLFCKDIVRTIR